MENPDKVGTAEIIIAKQRNGPTGVVKLLWDSNTTRFKNYDPHAHAPGGYDFGGGYATPSAAASGQRPPAPRPAPQSEVTPKPWTHAAPVDPPFAPSPPAAFSPGRKTGPIDNHRDGGGPDHDDEEGS
jgi:hypothetical protein